MPSFPFVGFAEPSLHSTETRLGTGADMSTISTENFPNGTAFTRPQPTNNKDIHVSDVSSDNNTQRSHNGTIAVAPVKPYQPYSSFERPTYLPQFGIGSYTDYVGVNPPFSTGRFSNYSDNYTQAFPSAHFGSNISPVGGNYWTDGRTHHSFSDPYQSYNYNKLNATYESLNKTAILRNNAYQESINRQALDSARTYYRGTHDNIQGIFSVISFNISTSIPECLRHRLVTCT